MIETLKKILYLALIKKSYSQDFEDLFLTNYFKKKDKGFYIDLGSHHPKRFSNTYLLYKKGWNGINIDANKFAINLFNFLRPRDQNISAVISTSNEQVNFYEFDEYALNGIISTKRVSRLEEMGYKVKRIIVISPITIQNIIDEFQLYEKQIDFLKIDLEGLDLQIIKNQSFLKLNIELLMIEKGSEEDNIEITKLLSFNSFKIIHESKRNYIFKNINSKN